jgi:hypothetical protein
LRYRLLNVLSLRRKSVILILTIIQGGKIPFTVIFLASNIKGNMKEECQERMNRTMHQNLTNIKSVVTRSIIKICIILYFLLAIIDELRLHRCILAQIPLIIITEPLSNFFSFSWLSDFWADSPFSFTAMICSLESRKWTGKCFISILPNGRTIGGLWGLRDPTNLLILEAVIFLSGLVLFLISLVHSSRRTVKEQNKIATGIYKYVRHPQNLALILMTFPFALYIPVSSDHGICFADLLCWVQFVVLLTLYSDYTDYRLRQLFPDTYPSYYQQTGFYLPKLVSIKELQFLSIFDRPILRYLCFLVIYLLIVLFFVQIYLSIDWPPIRIY